MLLELANTLLPQSQRNIVVTAVLALLGATLLRAALDPLLPTGIPFATYWLAIDIATFVAGWRSGVITVVGGTLLSWYLWLPPRLEFATDSSSLVAILTFIGLSAVQMTLMSLSRESLLALKASQAAQDLLVRELSHRLRNQFAVFGTLASQTLMRAPSLDEARTALIGRLNAMSQSVDAIVRPSGSTGLAPLLDGVVGPLAPVSHRLNVKGPDVLLPNKLIQPLALLLHELATNALKYGSWSNMHGAVIITWSVNGTELEFRWREVGGPVVAQPVKEGFGSALIRSVMPHATLQTDFTPFYQVRLSFSVLSDA